MSKKSYIPGEAKVVIRESNLATLVISEGASEGADLIAEIPNELFSRFQRLELEYLEVLAEIRQFVENKKI